MRVAYCAKKGSGETFLLGIPRVIVDPDMAHISGLLTSDRGLSLSLEICLRIAEFLIEVDPKAIASLLFASKVSDQVQYSDFVDTANCGLKNNQVGERERSEAKR